MMNHEINKAFRMRLDQGGAILMPGAANALAARVIDQLGFEAVYISGAGLTNTYLGMPDLGFVSLPEIAQHTSTIRNATQLPIVVDADTGFGNALNVHHTVRTLERAGASAIQLEDQVNPKRCGHFSGKDVVDLEEARSRIKAAADARIDPNFMIVARTDACAVHGFDAAIERAEAFIEDGADVTFIEAPHKLENIREIPARLAGTPQLINLVVGGKTPIIDFSELDGMGYALVLYANVALQGALKGMHDALSLLKSDGRMDEDGPVASFEIRQNAVHKSFYDDLEKNYSSK
ncbi:MAG: isocitrate lyase/phosphoenolpyruvate mutase family protein [Roseibium album]|uniref:2,3-dimethylmalate lyase n=1 Tax=Roseibium album TaxID=311410 RepID=A0A0M7AY95_9HYPH|nr:isocitrate lyase/phosphoenolpyruvate mutase family protein [Roseibium album]MBG6148497.1 2-methylisocitrate lyase-like PEP mutase family enzyme [Labrenzia sp. EL_142]MCR9056417.1 isocitrate lyase/phosphoenolpyruvate mutase family protein [Paracoccaceae bacterium]CTQ62147.1 2,3-dimethylmalate lyase [Roseibium album]CTQ78584.1 2,3-dimethylmalate lyase [Roseibium album]CTQ79912.1 2,3-dimethylmalate lyase [Roseibium album]